MSGSGDPNRPDRQDQAPTVPAGGWDGERTRPMPLRPDAAIASTTPPEGPPDNGATLATSPAMEVANADATRLTSPAEAATLPVTGGSLGPDTANPLTQSVLARQTGSMIRTLRTRVNLNLPAEARNLDVKLQTSRPSVLADMAATARHAIPPGIKIRIEKQTTEGRYHIDKPLAAGGMGAVLQITDNDFQRGAAMKVIHGQYAKHPEAVERFLAEAQVTAQLEHPNIVPIHDLGVMEDGTLYFTMKLIEGESLGRLVKKLRENDADYLAKWSIEEKLLVFLKVLDGVGFAHAQGVVHRDIKPDNIMLGPHGEVLVVDWGIAKVLAEADRSHDLVRKVETIRQGQVASETMAGHAMGTIYYMPPEQATGDLERIRAWSDIYSLGATLYELICLKRPLASGDMAGMLARATIGEIIPITTVVPDLHPDLVAVIAKAMQVTPELRYESCAAFSQDLRNFLAGQAVAARQRNLLERLGAWYGAHRTAVLGGLIGAILLTGATAGTAWWFDAQSRALAEAKFTEASTAFQAGALPDLKRAEALLAEASGLQPDDPRIAGLRAQVTATITSAETSAAAARDLDEKRRNAEVLLDQARILVASGDLEGAKARLDSARDLAPTHPAIDTLRDQVVQGLGDAAQKERLSRAATNKADGDALVAKAKILTLADPALDGLIAQADAAYIQSGKEGVSASGIQESLEVLSRFRATIAQDRTKAAATEEGEALLEQGRKALAANDLGTARDRAAAATERLAGRADAANLLAEIISRTQAAELERITAAKQDLAKADSRIASLMADLAKGPVDGSTVAQAQAQAKRAREGVAEHWQLAEAAAQSVISFLADDRRSTTVTEARALLAGLYHGRLQQARAEARLPEIAAFSNLLERYDDGAFAGERSGKARLRLTGPAEAAITLTRLISGPDTRLMVTGTPRTVHPGGEVIELEAGRWRLESEVVRWDMLVSANDQTVAWPVTPTAIPELPGLRLVPAEGTAPGFMLGEREVIHDDYARFVNDPAIAKPLIDELNTRLTRMASGEVVKDPLRLLPRRAVDAGDVWEVTTTGDRITGFVVPKSLRGLPVTGISRLDAEAYCAWLAKRTGRRVRLPDSAEWTRAAQGNDPQRLFPWGDAFAPGFCVTAYDTDFRDPLPKPPGSHPSDIGPFGHLDLGGNVHEWLADRSGRIGGMVAGGSFTTDRAESFTATARQSAQPEGVYWPIGFRILVELQ